jgi:hypothetical protein
MTNSRYNSDQGAELLGMNSGVEGSDALSTIAKGNHPQTSPAPRLLRWPA